MVANIISYKDFCRKINCLYTEILVVDEISKVLEIAEPIVLYHLVELDDKGFLESERRTSERHFSSRKTTSKTMLARTNPDERFSESMQKLAILFVKVVTFLCAIIAYFIGVHPIVENKLGIAIAWVIVGIFLTLLVIALVFYTLGFFGRKKRRPK